MSLSITEARTFDFAPCVPAVLSQPSVERRRDIYEQNRHRVYSLAFWMTDNELAAEALTIQVFQRAFAATQEPTADEIDRALVSELRFLVPIGTMSLNCQSCERVVSVRRNTRRVDLEQAVVQLPHTEKLMFLMHDVERYEHARIAELLDVTEDQSRFGVHQARLRVRELLVK
jgi:RNA polymerase sigma-70 factor, ECF subfamily